jgi:hypothetical protein
MLELAMQLVRIYHKVDDLPSKATRSQIEAKVRKLLSATSSDAITKTFSSARTLSSGYSWATRVYNLLDHELRWIQS